MIFLRTFRVTLTGVGTDTLAEPGEHHVSEFWGQFDEGDDDIVHRLTDTGQGLEHK